MKPSLLVQALRIAAAIIIVTVAGNLFVTRSNRFDDPDSGCVLMEALGPPPVAPTAPATPMPIRPTPPDVPNGGHVLRTRPSASANPAMRGHDGPPADC